MSDDKNKNNPPDSDINNDAVETADGDQPKSSVKPAVAETAFEDQLEDRSSARGGFPVLATLCLLLVIALAAAALWTVVEAQRREAALLDRLALLEAVTEREVMDATEQQAALQAVGEDLQDQMQAELRQGLSSLEPRISEHSGRLQELNSRLEELDEQVTGHTEELSRYSASDRESWLVAEVEYLLRLANQRLIMTGDAASAQALLRSADTILRQLQDIGIYPVRRAIAADLAALRAVPRIDTEGLYLRLSALSEEATDLSIFELPEAEERLQSPPADDWRGRLRQGYEAALHKLSDYIIIRRRETPMDVLMDPQWEGLVRQNLRMLLEQAQVALLSGNQALYRESLQRSRHWVSQFFESDAQSAHAMDEELVDLAEETVEVEMPDISRSLDALSQAVSTREQHAQEKGE